MIFFANIQHKSVEFLRYDLVIFMCGCKSLSKKADAVQVGPFVHEIMGLIFTGFLQSLGRKYIVCVNVFSGKNSRLNCCWLMALFSLLCRR